MKTTLSTRFHIAVWTVAVVLALVPLFKGQPAEQFTGTLIATLFWMAVYYLFFNYLTPLLLLPKKLVPFFAVSTGLVIVLPFIGYTLLLLSKALFRGAFTDFYGVYSLPMHVSGLKAMVLAGLYGSFFRLIVENFRKA